jgi:hypothetical protein
MTEPKRKYVEVSERNDKVLREFLNFILLKSIRFRHFSWLLSAQIVYGSKQVEDSLFVAFSESSCLLNYIITSVFFAFPVSLFLAHYRSVFFDGYVYIVTFFSHPSINLMILKFEFYLLTRNSIFKTHRR